MNKRGRPVVGGISGFFFGLFLGVTLLSFGILPLNSPVLTFLPIIGLALGLVLAFTAPIPRRGGSAPPAL